MDTFSSLSYHANMPIIRIMLYFSETSFGMNDWEILFLQACNFILSTIIMVSPFLGFLYYQNIPAVTQCLFNMESTLIQRHDVESMLSQF